MGLNITYKDISDATLGNGYARGKGYLIASYAAGWTITEIVVSGFIQTAILSQAANTNPWANAPILPPVTACLSWGPNGFTPVPAHAANYGNAQWLMLSEVQPAAMDWQILNGTVQIGSLLQVPITITWRQQIRVSVATDIYFQTFTDSSSAPAFTWQGTSRVVAS